jgi:hypothetical protein
VSSAPARFPERLVMDTITLLFSSIVTLCTFGSALLTVFLLAETRRMREVQTEPHVDFTYRVREEWIAHLDIVVRNIGLGAAHDVRFRAEPVTDDPETRALVRELTDIGFIHVGLNYLSPGQQASSFFTNVSENHNSKLASKFKVTVTYRSSGGRRYKDEYVIDLAELVGLRRIGEPPLHSMAKSLENLHLNVRELLGHEGSRSRANKRLS